MSTGLGTDYADRDLFAAITSEATNAAVIGDRLFFGAAPEETQSQPFAVYRLYDTGEDVIPVGLGRPVAQQLTYDVEWLVPGDSLDPVMTAVSAADALMDDRVTHLVNSGLLVWSRLSELRLPPAIDLNGNVWSRTGLRLQVDVILPTN